jgi:hypothetical protein
LTRKKSPFGAAAVTDGCSRSHSLRFATAVVPFAWMVTCESGRIRVSGGGEIVRITPSP